MTYLFGLLFSAIKSSRIRIEKAFIEYCSKRHSIITYPLLTEYCEKIFILYYAGRSIKLQYTNDIVWINELFIQHLINQLDETITASSYVNKIRYYKFCFGIYKT